MAAKAGGRRWSIVSERLVSRFGIRCTHCWCSYSDKSCLLPPNFGMCTWLWAESRQTLATRSVLLADSPNHICRHFVNEFASRFSAYQLPHYFREDFLNSFYDAKAAATPQSSTSAILPHANGSKCAGARQVTSQSSHSQVDGGVAHGKSTAAPTCTCTDSPPSVQSSGTSYDACTSRGIETNEDDFQAQSSVKTSDYR